LFVFLNYISLFYHHHHHHHNVATSSVITISLLQMIFLGGQLKSPVPLGQMIDILIDFWEADGLYD
jgi:hypothetical protein